MANKVQSSLNSAGPMAGPFKIFYLFQIVLIAQVLLIANAQAQTRSPVQQTPPAGEDKRTATVRYLEKASQVRAQNDSLIWLDSSKKAIYRDMRLPSAQWPGDQATAGKPVEINIGGELQNPAGIAVDSSGAVYIAEPSAAAIFRWTQEKGVEKIYSGEPLMQPTGIDIISNRIYVADVGAKKIFSFDLQQKKITEEFYRQSESFPNRLNHTAGELLAFDAVAKNLYRFPVASATKAPIPDSPQSWRMADSGDKKTLSSGQTLRLQKVLIDTSDFGVSQNVAYFLNPVKKQIVLLPLLGGAPVFIAYGRYATGVAAIAVDDDGIYLADEAGGRQVFLPLLIPANAYFEGGETAANIINFYSYLSNKNLLPTREYVLGEKDEIKQLVIAESILPSWDKRIEAVLCKLTYERKLQDDHIVCNKKMDDILEYKAGQKMVLPGLTINSYIGQRDFSLPYKKGQYGDEKYDKHAGEEVGDLAKELAPKDFTDEQLKQSLLELNPSYKGKNIMDEKEGFFLLPIESWVINAYVVKKDLIDEKSSLRRLLSRNFGIVSGALGARPQSTADLSPTLSGAVPPSLSDDTVLKLINYIPAEGAGNPLIGVIDNGFDSKHEEFKQGDGRSALTVYTSVEGDVTQTEGTGGNPDAKLSGVDHGTHVAALIGGRANKGQMMGIHPGVELYGIKQGDFDRAISRGEKDDKGLNIRTKQLRIFNISLGGEDPEIDGWLNGSIQNEIINYVKQSDGRLFMVSAGNISGRIKPNTLAYLGDHDNVIVVGATKKSDPDNLLPQSGSDSKLVNVVAPGESINSAIANGGYKEASGTSQATAIVTGIAALLRDKEPEWEMWQIKHRIVSTADLWSADKGVFSGMVNVKRAVSDTRKVVINLRAGETNVECKGNIPESQLSRELNIRDASSSKIVVDYRSLLRLERSKTDSNKFTIIFSGTGEVDTRYTKRLNHTLDRKFDIAGQDIGTVEEYTITDEVIEKLRSEGLSDAILNRLGPIQNTPYSGVALFQQKIRLALRTEFAALSQADRKKIEDKIVEHTSVEKDNEFLFNPELSDSESCCLKENGRCKQRRIDLRDLNQFVNIPYKYPIDGKGN